MDIKTPSRHALEIWGAIGLFLVVGLVFAWCSSSDRIDTKKGDQQAQIAANANANSEVHQTEADALANQANQAQTDANTKRDQFKQAAAKARQRKKYDEVRKDPVVIDNSNIDARERKLLTDLRKLYWQQK